MPGVMRLVGMNLCLLPPLPTVKSSVICADGLKESISVNRSRWSHLFSSDGATRHTHRHGVRSHSHTAPERPRALDRRAAREALAADRRPGAASNGAARAALDPVPRPISNIGSRDGSLGPSFTAARPLRQSGRPRVLGTHCGSLRRARKATRTGVSSRFFVRGAAPLRAPVRPSRSADQRATVDIAGRREWCTCRRCELFQNGCRPLGTEEEDHGNAGHVSTNLRFSFGSWYCTDCQVLPCNLPIVNGVRYSKEVLASATRIASIKGTSARRSFTVESFAVYTASAEHVRQIACKIPLHRSNYMGLSESNGDAHFGPFVWRLLAPHDNVRTHLGVRRLSIYNYGRHIHPEDTIAYCSAILTSRTLQEVSFRQTSDYIVNTSWPEWLVFAFFSKAAQHKIQTVVLSLHGRSMPSYVDALKKTIEHESGTLKEKHGRLIQWPATTVSVNAQVSIHGFDLPKANRATSVYHGKRPVECLVVSQDYGSSARILIPGIGIGCVARKDVISQQPARLREKHPIRSLTISLKSRNYSDNRSYVTFPFDATSVIELLRLIGEPLEKLTLESLGDRPFKSLRVDDVLVHCPNLKSLKLVNLTLTDEQLFASRHGQSLQSLTLLACDVLGKPSALGSRVFIPPCTFPQLLSLYFDATGGSPYRPVPESPSIPDYILELAIERKLHRLVVKCSDAKQRARYAAHVEHHHGELIPVLPLREKLAFLSVVTAGPSTASTAKFELTMDVVALVFEMASTSMRRRLCTLLE